MTIVLSVVAICLGVAIMGASGCFVRSGETTRTAWTGQSESSGHPRSRRTYNRAVVMACGAAFIVFGILDLAGVTAL